MGNPIGVYWSVAHRRPQDYDYFRRLNPSVIKVMDGGDVDYKWIRENLPDALVVARIHALSEQHSDMLKDPIATGKRHAQEWNGHQQRLGFDKAKTLILGLNEPRVWESGVPEALRRYTIALCEEATVYGLRVGAMQLSVGWPNNTGPDTPPNWEPFRGVDTAIRANNGALVTHEYFADNGPGENWGWWCGRTLKCPWQVPIVIGECGVDMYVKDGSVPHANRGWRGHMDAEQYARYLADYVGRMSADKRFVGCCVFASDFANREWFSFDVEPAYAAILAQPIPKPTTVHIPSVIAPGPTPPQPATFYVAVRDGANLRAAPSVDAAKLTAAAYGQSLTVISATPNRDWLQVAWDGQTGWVLAALLSVEPPPPAPAPGGPTPPVPPAPTGIIDPMTALAFLQVESANAAFRDGLLVIRFEVHVFKTELRNDALFDMHFKFTPRNYSDQWWRPTPNADWINAHGPMPERHKLLAFARSLNDTAALRSTGMGSAQVMGANAARIGYATPQAMFNAFRHARYGVNAQVLGFVNYVLSDPALVDALRRRDWREMARRYNGISQVDVYAPLLEKALAEIGREVGA